MRISPLIRPCFRGDHRTIPAIARSKRKRRISYPIIQERKLIRSPQLARRKAMPAASANWGIAPALRMPVSPPAKTRIARHAFCAAKSRDGSGAEIALGIRRGCSTSKPGNSILAAEMGAPFEKRRAFRGLLMTQWGPTRIQSALHRNGRFGGMRKSRIG